LFVHLSICFFVPIRALAESLLEQLSLDNCDIKQIDSPEEFIKYLVEQKQEIDCLVILNEPKLLPVFNRLYEQGILLPTVLIDSSQIQQPTDNQIFSEPVYIYHGAEIRLSSNNLHVLPEKISDAIAQFIHLGQSCSLLYSHRLPENEANYLEENQNFLVSQQAKLVDKLKKRLGYLGIYYRRNPKLFFRNLDKEERNILIEEISQEYRGIILNYFSKNIDINSEIDQFVNKLFFCDLSVSQLLEIHMKLMEDFSQQLKLEGRSEEILLDYRLAIIDVLAHICEMYRRSIPREDIIYDFLGKTK